MADAAPSAAPSAAPAKKPGGSFLTILSFAAVFLILLNPQLNQAIGRYVGVAFDPVFRFDDAYPVLTILLVGTLMVLLTTLVRHFTTDWLEQARTTAYMRAFQKEFSKARKENNTYKLKKLGDKQPELMRVQQQMQAKQMKNMPLTMLIVVPIFAWLFLFITRLDYWWFTAPWNQHVDMFTTEGVLFGSSVFPHYILLYMTLSIPLGALVQKAMKYASWKERWQRRHPEVHE